MTSPTWNSAAAEAASLIYQQIRKKPRADLEQIRVDYESFVEELYHVATGYDAATQKWAVIGADALEWGQQKGFKINEDTLVKILIKKQRDYGPENIRRFGRQGLMVRMHDKIARLQNLTSHGRDPENESIADTVLDIAGYAAIGIMWERQKFLLPLV